MTEPVAEVLAEAGGLDRPARDRIRLDAGEPRLDPRDRLQLRVQADVVGSRSWSGSVPPVENVRVQSLQ